MNKKRKKISERAYIMVSNLAKLKIAENLLRDVLEDDEAQITKADIQTATTAISELRRRCEQIVYNEAN